MDGESGKEQQKCRTRDRRTDSPKKADQVQQH